ncbi:MAG: lysophospholipid acyltransferase family protein [Fluviibacter sp.]
MIALRSALFTLILAGWTVFCGTLVLCAYVLPEAARFKSCYAICQMWRYGFMAMCQLVLGIRCRIEGRENISAAPAIYLAKHQSAWETIALQIWTPPAIFVLKRELLAIPFFGWALWGLRMIWIDRSAGKAALEKIVTQGQKRLAQGLSIIIFPEGTRVAPGKMGKFKAGGARLAVRTGASVIPVAHNAGELWPRNAFIKKPGTITVRFGPAIDPAGLTDSELNERVETWIREAMRELPPVRH